MAQAPRLSPQEMADLSSLFHRMAHDPKTRAATAQIVAQIDPATARGAFFDVVQDAKLNRVLKKIEDDRMHEKASKMAEASESQKQAVISKRQLNPDQVKELERIQTHYGLRDWDAAADIYATRNPPDDPRLQPPPEIRSSTWDFPTVPGPDGKPMAFKDFIGNPRKYATDTAYQMITEFKRGRLPASFHA